MVSDFFEFYGKGEEQKEMLMDLYAKLYNEQYKRKEYNPLNLRINKIPHSITKKLQEVEKKERESDDDGAR